MGPQKCMKNPFLAKKMIFETKILLRFLKIEIFEKSGNFYLIREKIGKLIIFSLNFAWDLKIV